jgi:2-oxoglutarate ferredoxin oxidoreductase subunit delta
MQKGKTVVVSREKCIGCGACVSLCPKRILYIDGDGKCAVTDGSQCDLRAGCERVCPVSAIRITRG